MTPIAALPSRAAPGALAGARPSWGLPGLLAAAVLAAMAAPAALVAQGHPERVQGHVTEPSGAPIAGALVEVTRGPDRLTLSSRTDAAGAFSVRFAEGTGDYLVHVTAIGWQAYRQRVTSAGADSVLTANPRLAVDPVRLAPVQAQTRRARTQRGPVFGRETGAADALTEGVEGALSPDQQGDLSQLAATVPGIIAAPGGGVTALGLSGQSSTTVNGLAFAGGSLPRDVRTRTRVSYSTYDPARGGFGSAQVSVEVPAGGTYTLRRGHFTVDAPALQVSDAAAARLGQEFSSLQASVGGEGELLPERLYYNAGVQASFRRAEAPSLLSPDGEVLRLLGVSPDSVARLVSLLSSLGVPSRAGAGSWSTLRRLSFLGRLDRKPRSSDRIWGLTGFLDAARTEPLAAAFNATPGHGGESGSTVAGLQGVHSFYFGRGYLSETKSGFTYSRQRSTPYFALPEGRVRVTSADPAGEGGIASFAFGGNGSLESGHRFWTWESTSEVQAYTRASRHKAKLFADLRLDGDWQSPAGNRLGTFTFNSLADLEAARPASFTRVLQAPAASGGEWSAALAVGDLWKRTERFQLLYGLRFEGNRYTASPAFNPAVASTFGVRNDHAPNTVHASPRLGFTWAYGPRAGDGMMVGSIGSRYLAPHGVLRGGIGEFRTFPRPALLAGAQARTGLPGGTVTLSCIGPAAPTPAWGAYASGDDVPSRCADGAGGVEADAAPPVELFARGYRPARSWRANLGWTPVTKHVGVAVDGVVSLNLEQPGWADLNFSGVPRFSLENEAGRPVFVTPASIVTATGAVSPVEARVSPLFGRVVERRSDLRSLSEQVTVTATPDLDFGRYFLSLAYTLGQVRSLERGFTAGTVGDPNLRSWAPGALDVRHQLQLQAGWSLPGRLTLSMLTRVSSGLPYTPAVGGDVNGDGFANDRAFVFDPAASADEGVAAGLRALLGSAPGGARACLSRQLGRPAEVNSCRGPWTVAMNARLEFAGKLLHTPRRMTVALNLANPLAGADRLLHGADGLRGWGAAAFPDPTLYYVRGFDPATRRFRYEVNPRFGATSAAAGLVREPFRLTLDVSLNLGPSLPGQQVRLMLRPGRTRPGTRLTAAAIAQRYARTVEDVYEEVLEQGDSLFLSREQVQAIRAAQAEYRARADSVWLALGTYMAGLPERYDLAEALRRQEDATKAQWAIINEEGPKLKRLLSPLQVRLLGPSMHEVFEGRAMFGRTFVG